ncbi:MAG TPA: ABC transporter permease subunit, partial [Clostridia bacterium]|nr:ABC transporter permease subunit [Clostridia bacterium]
MRLQPDILLTLFRTELRMLFRDRRVLIMSIAIPVLIMPLLFFGSQARLKQREQKLQDMTCRYAVEGSQTQPVRDLMTATTARLEREQAGRTNKPALRAIEVPSSDPMAALNRNDIQVILKGLTPAEYQSGKGTNHAGAKTGRDRPNPDEKIEAPLVVELVGRADRDDSMSCVGRITEALKATRMEQRTGLLRGAGFHIAPAEAGAITEVDLASKRQVGGLALGRFITALLLVFILSGGAVAAIDSLAGEKERGTLETLLTTSASRLEIIIAKLLTVLALAFLITAIQSANLLAYVGFKLIPLPTHFAAAITPGVAVLLLVLYLPLAALAAGVLLLISGHAKTYKEAQMLFFPVFLVGLAPALAPMFPGLPLHSAVVLLPVAGLAVAARDILIGLYDWPMILAAWLSTAAAAGWTAWIGVRYLSAERLITAADTDAADLAGGPALFRRHVLRWFAVLWGALLITNNY